MITYQDYEKAENQVKFIQKAIQAYRNSEEYKKALEEAEYMAGRNTNILRVQRVIYNMAGLPENDFTKTNIKTRNRMIHRLVTDRCSYLLGNGVSFASKKKVREVVTDENGTRAVTRIIDTVKDYLGDKFDNAVYRWAYWACANGESFLYPHINKDRWVYSVFKKTEFLPLKDEETGELRGGIRFWSLDWGKRPINAVLYLKEGYIRFKTPEKKYGISSLEQAGELTPYIVTTEESEAYGEVVTGSVQLAALPIIPLLADEEAEGALDNLKPDIDASDLILSGFANDINDCAQVYWLISGALGMTEDQKRQLLDRLILQHMAVVDGESSKIQGFTQEVPYESRKEALNQLRAQMIENYGGFDVHAVSAANTNDHIEALYWPMDKEADSFEFQLIESIQQMLLMMGIEDMPMFIRDKVTNQKDVTEMVLSAYREGVIDKQTVLEKLPWISVDEIDNILERLDGAEVGRYEDLLEPEEEEEE